MKSEEEIDNKILDEIHAHGFHVRGKLIILIFNILLNNI
jgi:hypothetical protein